MSEPPIGTSVGRLKMLTPEKRAVIIAQLPLVTRHRLAHYASLGLKRSMKAAEEYRKIIEELTGSA